MEIWRKIAGFPSYEVSSEGRVRSLDRVVEAGGVSRKLRGKVLKPARHDFGYPFVMLGQGNCRKIHTLVAEAFLGPRPEGFYVCHKDGRPDNNHVDNLYYGSPKENQSDRRKHGTFSAGETHPRARLSNEDVTEIRRQYEAGRLQRAIAEEFGVTQSAVSLIVNRKKRTHG